MSFDLNKVMLAGRIAVDPVRRDVGADAYVCNFSLATNRKLKDGKEDVCFVDIEVWGKAADAIINFGRKGTPIFVEGSLKMEKWQTQDGKARQKLSVRADFCRFTAPRDHGDEAAPVAQPVLSKPAPTADDDSIPF